MELKLYYGNTGRGTDIMAGKLYYEPGRPSGFSTLKQLHAVARDSKFGKTARELRAWLEAQNAFTR